MGKLRLETSLKFEAVLDGEVKEFATGSGAITGLGKYVGKKVKIIILSGTR